MQHAGLSLTRQNYEEIIQLIASLRYDASILQYTRREEITQLLIARLCHVSILPVFLLIYAARSDNVHSLSYSLGSGFISQ